MRTTLRGKKIELTSAIRAEVQKKIVQQVERLLDSGGSAAILDLEFERSRHHRKGNVFRAEANLTVGKKLLRAESEGEDIHACIDAVRDKVAQEIKKFKAKFDAQKKRGTRAAKRELRYDPAAQFRSRGRIWEEGS